MIAWCMILSDDQLSFGMKQSSSSDVLTECVLLPPPVCFQTTIMTFPPESSFFSVHIIKVLKRPIPVSLSLSLSPFPCQWFSNRWVYCWFTHSRKKFTWHDGVCSTHVSHFHLRSPAGWGRTSYPVHLTGMQQEATHRRGSLTRWERPAASVNHNNVIPSGMSASFCALAGVCYKLQ